MKGRGRGTRPFFAFWGLGYFSCRSVCCECRQDRSMGRVKTPTSAEIPSSMRMPGQKRS